MTALGNFVQDRRIEFGLTQITLARMGVDTPYISVVETDVKVTLTNLDAIQKNES